MRAPDKPPPEPPANIEAEQSLLGAILINNDAFRFVADFLEPEHFFEPLHAQIFEIVSGLIRAGKRATPVTIKAFFPGNANVRVNPDLTLRQYFARLVAEATTVINAYDYGRAIFEDALRRRTIEIAEDVVFAARDRSVAGVNVGDLHRSLEALINTAHARKPIAATPFQWFDPATIPPRAWLYGRHHIKQFLTCTVALGGVGKSSLAIVEALAMVTGRPLLGIEPRQRCRVWLWNGEDPGQELQRRVAAAMLYFGIDPADIDGALFLDNGRDLPIKLMTQTGGAVVAVPMVKDEIVTTLKHHEIDALIIDPFVKSHQVPENDNGAIDAVCTEWARIADIADCAIDVNHHPRKTGGAEVTAEDTRGGSSLISATRSARVGNSMTKDEATEAGIEPRDRWRYFRIDNGKANMSPPPDKAQWYRLDSQALGNGDEVGVVTMWTWPDAFAGMTAEHLKAAQKAVSKGGPWRADPRAADWVGVPIAKAVGLDLDKPSDRRRIAPMLKTWKASGMFVEVVREDEHRHEKRFVEVGKWADD